MSPISSFVPQNVEEMRQQVLERFAVLFSNQTRTNLFAENVSELVHDIHSELDRDLRESIRLLDDAGLGEREKKSIVACLQKSDLRSSRLDRALLLLFQERQRQWEENGKYLKKILLDFNSTIESLAGTLIEKDLLERQSKVLETIVLSHEKVTQWKVFVQDILTGFHTIFPFHFFFIAFAEENGLALYLYYLGDFTTEIKGLARTKLAKEMIGKLDLPFDAPLDIEEFQVLAASAPGDFEPGDIEMITVPVPDLGMPNLSGMLGVAFASTGNLSAQEESVIRSTLAVMVMVVGSSKTLSRTLSELEYYSTHDPLTGLHNRRYLNEMLDYEVGRSERHNREFAVLMVDLDDFKDINDSYGHPCGDSVLKRVAETVRSVTRKGDVATRIGGDEFAVVLAETGKTGALAVAEKLRTELRRTVFGSQEGKSFHITVSIGLVAYPEDAQSVSDLMAAVDLGLYRAKAMGKDVVGSIDEAKHQIRAGREIRDQAEKLRVALENGWIVPYFQPIFDCRTGQIFAHETLARLKEPDGETVSAGMFIETIEKYGLGRDLDRLIIQNALTVMKSRIDEGNSPTRFFINLSAQEIQSRGILGFAEELCGKLKIPPAGIIFELLERDAIGDMTNMRKFLTNLRKKGFSFALDDFGSGYNSFHYLRELHFDYVKLDGAFVRNILNSKVDRTLVRNLIRLCREMDILTVAEFVESQEILEALMEMGVDYAQGFHLGVPQPGLGDPGAARSGKFSTGFPS